MPKQAITIPKKWERPKFRFNDRVQILETGLTGKVLGLTYSPDSPENECVPGWFYEIWIDSHNSTEIHHGSFLRRG